MAGAKHTELMDVELDALWNAITDYESYVDFVDGMESVTITKKEGNDTYADYELRMFGKKIKYSLKLTEKPKKRVAWEMLEGEFFKHNNGSWDLQEKGKGKVEATYSVDVGFPLLVPKSIVNTLTGTQLPSMMESFLKRAQKISKKKSKK